MSTDPTPDHDSEVWQTAAGWIHGCRTRLDRSIHATEAEAADRQRDHLRQPVPWWVHRIGAAPTTATLPAGDERDARPRRWTPPESQTDPEVIVVALDPAAKRGRDRGGPMSPDAAAWVRDHVLTPTYRANTVDPARCPCQWGPSGHCLAERHDRCPRTQGWERHGQPSPDTWITDAQGMVAHAPGVTAAVWRAGTPCRWLCPCTCHATVAALFPLPPQPPVRKGVELPIAATDRLRRGDPQQPTLPGLP